MCNFPVYAWTSDPQGHTGPRLQISDLEKESKKLKHPRVESLSQTSRLLILSNVAPGSLSRH